MAFLPSGVGKAPEFIETTPGIGAGSGFLNALGLGGGGGLSAPLLGLKAIGGFLGGFFKGRQQSRNMKNQFLQQLALDRALAPNRALQDALRRNIRGNILQNLSLGGEDLLGLRGLDRVRAFNDLLLRSISGGINPLLIREQQNIAGIPGLRIGGRLVGEDPTKFFKPKGPGFLESLAGGIGGLFGG